MASLAADRADRDSESSEEGGLFGGLFVDEDYKEETFSFDDTIPGGVSVLCSKAASTDFDLTGQVVWPVSIFLSWFIVQRPELFRGRAVLEVGAGCGLPGLVAARVGAASVVLTDGSDVVMRLLQRQVAHHGNTGKVTAHKLEWGNEAALNDCVGACSGEGVGARPSVVIGADVVCWPACVVPLLESCKALLQGTDDPFAGRCYVGYVCRATNTRDEFFREAAAHGFACEKINARDFLPPPAEGWDAGADEAESETGAHASAQRGWPANVRSRYDLEVYSFWLDRSSPAALQPARFVGLVEGAHKHLPY